MTLSHSWRRPPSRTTGPWSKRSCTDTSRTPAAPSSATRRQMRSNYSRTKIRTEAETLVEKFEYDRYDVDNDAVASDRNLFSTHRLSKKTNALGNDWRFDYDDAACSCPLLPTTGTTPEGLKTRSVYNNRGERTSVTDADGNVHVSTFNAQGRLVEYTDPNQSKVGFNYYPCGDWLSEIWDQSLKPTEFTRDPDGK